MFLIQALGGAMDSYLNGNDCGEVSQFAIGWNPEAFGCTTEVGTGFLPPVLGPGKMCK